VITEAWLPAELAEVVTKDKVRQAPLYRVLSDVGIIVERLQHNITAEIAGPRYAQLLDTTIGSALLRIDRVAFVDDLPHHLVSCFCRRAEAASS
jgi:GntR family transcriptional regulator